VSRCGHQATYRRELAARAAEARHALMRSGTHFGTARAGARQRADRRLAPDPATARVES
jgi:hypothetical protein